MRYFRFALCAALVGTALGTANAAQVPAGTVLAEKQEIVRHIKDEPASLDPIKAVGLIEAQVDRDLFEGLVNQNAQGEVIPGVASHWQTTDNQTYIFTLRRDAKWSNGDPVTAQDFVYSWRRLVDPKSLSPFAWFAELAGVENAQQIIAGTMSPDTLGVSAVDQYTLKVKLNRPVPYFPSLTANFSLFPVPQSVVEKYGSDWTKVGNLVGNGAFKLQDRVVNEKLVLVPNEHYWDHANTVLTKVTFIPINQEANATKRYQAGDIDITESFPKNLYQKLLKDIPDQVYTPDQLGTYYYAFNTQRAPTNDVRVRKALSYAIDRKIIAEKVLGTGEKPAYHFTPDVTAGYHPVANALQQQDQDELNAQAKALLHAAGYGPDKPLKLSLLYNTSDNNQKLAIAIASMWKKTLGVDVQMINQEWKTYIDSRNTGNFDVVRASWVGDYNEPSTFLSLLTSTHSGNIAKFKSENYDHVLNEASRQTNPKLLNDDYNKAEQIIAEQVPIAPIYQFTNGRLIKPWVKGYPITNPEDVAYSHTMYIIKH
ncbi:peptide ABC transporter substrate-binding protein [Yersinia enterocolitica]|jgi:oligopeptide transport system substrate-binding protein|uniref:Oligopeptide ABC transporter substrate-binding protein OppA n=1 Tax=Yersinia massiliensis TaxID=419257 RepID=A0ABM6UU31_9GAMM|nr:MULTISPECIES: ABC transporter substrate-binding protein [Yersinia]HEI6964238.1 oligopeptide ABC transporter substrate-binding protein OppA [Yersinia enterocolitica]ATM85808.1 oligopeptide ABC transporter substrate-binding protein OppA [Yersinia frederiksenii]AVX38257.1 oligopeptide ABC transporter substrate-binding protein OppA [Yersinia massiliensis]MCB5316569.1 ABC transporter substrate-binding protein [Yersinia massiliensis]QKJ13038.1 oligopeptide ABC transporter substrate-binding protei